jgi:hypothetical protein
MKYFIENKGVLEANVFANLSHKLPYRSNYDVETHLQGSTNCPQIIALSLGRKQNNQNNEKLSYQL